MTPERWQEIKRVFEGAVEYRGEARVRFVVESCVDEAMRAEVERMLAADDAARDFMERPVVSLSELAAETEADFVNRRIGAYRVVREIGRGGMGAVYLAERDDEQYQKLVAIKVIKRGMDTDYVLNRFRTERQILAGLEHPNIARLIDGGVTEDGLPFFAMEYVDGQAVNEYVTTHNLSIRESLKLFRTICAAVSYAHRHLVIHRDLKPSNILVTGDGTVKLLDFGIAKVLTNTEAEAATTMQMMTPEYASPEQVSGGTITTATDVYSLGIVLYELLTGRHPFQFASRRPDHIAKVICETEPERPSLAIADLGMRNADSKANSRTGINSQSPANPQSAIRNPQSLRGDLDTITLTALRKEPARRYLSVEKFSDDIRRYLTGLPVSARPATFSYRAEKFIRRNKVAVTAACIILVTLIGGIVATTWQAYVANTNRILAERRFDDVRRLANSFVFKYHDAIENLPGATPVREMLVRDAVEYLDRLATDTTGNASLQNELAAAYMKIGDVQGARDYANLGDSTAALASYKKAETLFNQLAAAERLDFEALDAQRKLLGKIGSLHTRTGDAQAALDYQRKALAISEAMAGRAPADLEQQRQLALSYIYLGDAAGDATDPDEMLRYHRQAVPLLERIVRDDSSNIKFRRALMMNYQRIGTDLSASGKHLTEEGSDADEARRTFREAAEYHRRTVDIAEVLVTEEPLNAAHKRNLAAACTNTGSALVKAGVAREGLPFLLRAREFFAANVAADAADREARLDLATGDGNLGNGYIEAGDIDLGIKYAREALTAFDAILAADSSNADARRLAFETRLYLGDALMIKRDSAKAALNYRMARELADIALRATPTSVQSRRNLEAANLRLARVENKVDLSERRNE